MCEGQPQSAVRLTVALAGLQRQCACTLSWPVARSTTIAVEPCSLPHHAGSSTRPPLNAWKTRPHLTVAPSPLPLPTHPFTTPPSFSPSTFSLAHLSYYYTEYLLCLHHAPFSKKKKKSSVQFITFSSPDTDQQSVCVGDWCPARTQKRLVTLAGLITTPAQLLWSCCSTSSGTMLAA